jgi:imidazolonepropionase-like amidohydrolase
MRQRVDTPERIRHLVRVNIEHGVDWIKTRSSERAGGPLTDPRELVYNQEQLGAMVEEAGLGGAPVECHVQGDVGAAPAIRAGVRMIEHGWYLSEDSLRLMKEHGTYWDPTTPALLDVASPEHDYQSVVSQIRAPYMLANVRRNIKKAYEMGVKLVTGTDTSYGPDSVSRIATEITNFVEWGVPPLAALQAATIVSAEAYRLEGRTGAIEEGLEADLVAYDRNPLQDIWVVHDPTLVISNGRIALDRALVPLKPGRVPGDDE